MSPPVLKHLLQETDFLQDEIRQLEREFNTLSHKSSTISASCQRDRAEVEKLRGEALRAEAEVRDWTARDATLASSVVALQGSGQLLAEMEVQARTGLDEEIRRTREQRAQMERSINGAKRQAREVEERMMKVEVYALMKEIEEKVRKGRQELEMRKHQGGGAGTRQALLRGDKQNWGLFKACVVDTAKAWKGEELASKVVAEEARALDECNGRFAMFMQEQARREEARRRAEQEGRTRLEKVSLEVDRMERVVGEENSVGTKSSLGGKGDSVDGRDYMKGMEAMVGQMDDDRLNCQSQRSCNLFSVPTSPPNYVPPTPRRLGVQLKLSTSMLKRTPSSSQVHAEQQRTHELSNPKVVESPVLPVHAPLYQGERLPLTSLSQHEQQSSQRMVRPGAPPQHLGLQMRAGQHYGMQPQQQQGKDNIDHYSNHFFAEDKNGRDVRKMSVEIGGGVMSGGAGNILNVGDGTIVLNTEDHDEIPSNSGLTTKNLTPEMSGCPRSQQQVPYAGSARLPLPKLKSMVRPESCQEQRIANRMTAVVADPSSQVSLRTDIPSSTSSLKPNSSLPVTDQVEVDCRSYSADSEKKTGNNMLSGKVLPKLKLPDLANLKRKKDDDENVVIVQANMESKHLRPSSVTLVSTSEENIATTEESLGSQIPAAIENLTHGADQNICIEQKRKACGSQQREPAVLAQGNFDQNVKEEGEYEEDDFYDAEGGDLVGTENMNERGKAEEGEIVETALPSSKSCSPRTTPAKRRLSPLKLSPGTALNDSKRQAALEDLLNGISEDEDANHATPSQPKAPKLQFSSTDLSLEQKSCQEGHPKERNNTEIPFNMVALEQGGFSRPPAARVLSPTADSSSGKHVTQEECSKDLFGGRDVAQDFQKQDMIGSGEVKKWPDSGFSFNFAKDELNDTMTTDNSFSFFGGGDCKSPEKKGDGGDFFLNFGADDDDNMGKDGGFSFF